MAVGAYALTSLANLQSYLGVSAGSDDTIQEKCIDRATAMIESYIGHRIMSRAYVVWLDCRGTGRIRLPDWPVVSMNFVGYGARDAIAVTADASVGDSDASISIAPTAGSLVAVTLTHARVPSSGTIPTTGTILGATYDLCSEMATQLDAVTGFDADLVADAASRHLHRVGPLQLVNAGTAYLTVPDRNGIEWRCEHETGLLDVVRVARYWPDDAQGEYGVPAMWQSICVDYTAGWATVPDDIEQACLRVSAFLYRNRKRDEGVSSESLGDYSYTLRDSGQVRAMLEDELESWRDIR
jgi:hypothetical protein